MRDDISDYVGTTFCCASEAISIIDCHIGAFRRLVHEKFSAHNDRPASQYHDDEEFSEDANGNVASIRQQLLKKQRFSQGF
jgi:hypothetical protein